MAVGLSSRRWRDSSTGRSRTAPAFLGTNRANVTSSVIPRVRKRTTNLIIEFSDKFQVRVFLLPEEDAIPLLGHEDTERDRQIVLQESIFETHG